MKNLFLLLFLSIIVSCQNTEKKENASQPEVEEVEIEEIDAKEVAYVNYGEDLTQNDALSEQELSEFYQNLKVGDTVMVKIASNINSVCKKKGCWMKLAVEDENEIMVRFKDYGFFVPKNSKDREVIVEGMAFLDETSVEDLQHYAEDEGKSQEEIDAITEPKITYAFTAVGALVEGTEEDFKGQVEGLDENAEESASE